MRDANERAKSKRRHMQVLLSSRTTIIDGFASDRVLDVRSGTVSIQNLDIRDGAIDDNGAGIRNNGDLTLTNDVVMQNQASSSSDGGGVYNEPGASLTLNGTTVK